jgi:hypothetical protein
MATTRWAFRNFHWDITMQRYALPVKRSVVKMIPRAARARSARVGRGRTCSNVLAPPVDRNNGSPPRSASATPDARDFVYRVSPLLVKLGNTIDFEDAVQQETSAKE